MKKRTDYEKPSMKVFVLKQKPTLLAGSVPPPTSASVDAYENPDTPFSW